MEAGYTGFEATSWFALMAPLGTGAPIVAKLNAEIVKMVAQPATKGQFAKLGIDTVGGTPDALGAIVKADIAKWAKVIKEAGIKAE